MTEDHEWIRMEADGTATVGITNFAQEQLGDIVYVDLPAAGSSLSANAICGEIESTKSVGELYAPLSGEVVEINDAVDADPSLVNADAFGEGWLIKVRVNPADVDSLLDRAAYTALTGGSE